MVMLNYSISSSPFYVVKDIFFLNCSARNNQTVCTFQLLSETQRNAKQRIYFSKIRKLRIQYFGHDVLVYSQFSTVHVKKSCLYAKPN